MIPTPYTIQSQEINEQGYYSFPFQLSYIDKMPPYEETIQRKICAIITAVAECTKKRFEVILFHKKGFIINFLDNKKVPLFIISLERYSLIGNKLILT